MSSLRNTLLEPKDMDDPRYSDEKLMLRAEAFRALTHHLTDHCRAVYEFCSEWVETHDNIDNIEQNFQNYLRSVVERSYAKSS